MENSVTLTLRRYHELIDIEQDLVKLQNKKLDQYSQSELFSQQSVLISKLREENDNLRLNVKQAKNLIFYISGTFLICLFLLILSQILQ